MTDDTTIVNRIIARHGDVINLRESPGDIIDIIRSFRFELDDPDGGPLPGGTPPPPPPPPGPSSRGVEPTLSDLMREILKLSKQVATLRQAGP